MHPVSNHSKYKESYYKVSSKSVGNQIFTALHALKSQIDVTRNITNLSIAGTGTKQAISNRSTNKVIISKLLE